jgi:hypothetical protein
MKRIDMGLAKEDGSETTEEGTLEGLREEISKHVGSGTVDDIDIVGGHGR